MTKCYRHTMCVKDPKCHVMSDQWFYATCKSYLSWLLAQHTACLIEPYKHHVEPLYMSRSETYPRISFAGFQGQPHAITTSVLSSFNAVSRTTIDTQQRRILHLLCFARQIHASSKFSEAIIYLSLREVDRVSLIFCKVDSLYFSCTPEGVDSVPRHVYDILALEGADSVPRGVLLPPVFDVLTPPSKASCRGDSPPWGLDSVLKLPCLRGPNSLLKNLLSSRSWPPRRGAPTF